jgi:hypothetical protein
MSGYSLLLGRLSNKVTVRLDTNRLWTEVPFSGRIPKMELSKLETLALDSFYVNLNVGVPTAFVLTHHISIDSIRSTGDCFKLIREQSVLQAGWRLLDSGARTNKHEQHRKYTYKHCGAFAQPLLLWKSNNAFRVFC